MTREGHKWACLRFQMVQKSKKASHSWGSFFGKNKIGSPQKLCLCFGPWKAIQDLQPKDAMRCDESGFCQSTSYDLLTCCDSSQKEKLYISASLWVLNPALPNTISLPQSPQSQFDFSFSDGNHQDILETSRLSSRSCFYLDVENKNMWHQCLREAELWTLQWGHRLPRHPQTLVARPRIGLQPRLLNGWTESTHRLCAICACFSCSNVAKSLVGIVVVPSAFELFQHFANKAIVCSSDSIWGLSPEPRELHQASWPKGCTV